MILGRGPSELRPTPESSLTISTCQIDGSELRVRFDQKGDVFDIPITVTIVYANGTSEDVTVKVTQATTERVIPLKGAVRSIEVNKDGGSLAEIEK